MLAALAHRVNALAERFCARGAKRIKEDAGKACCTQHSKGFSAVLLKAKCLSSIHGVWLLSAAVFIPGYVMCSTVRHLDISK